MSATMSLLKGNKGAKAAPAPDTTDEELEAPAASNDAGDEEAGEPEDATVEELNVAEEEQGVEQEAGVSIPTSKTEVHQLKQKELPGVHEAMGSPIAGFDKLGLKEQKQALLDYLFPKGGKAKASVSGNDMITQITAEIEQLTTRAAVEEQLQGIIKLEGENFFRKGGLLVKLSEIGDFGEHANLQEYILANGIARDYRSARYWMSIYTGLIDADIPYNEVEEIGWTKLVVLLPVLTKDNVAEWKAKALAVNVATLQSMVDAETKPDDKKAGGASGDKPIKSMVFKFHKDQTDTANDAIAKAKKIAGTEHKEVAADLIFTEYLANAPNKAKKPEVPAKEVVQAGYDPDTLDVERFFKAIAEKFPDPKDAMAFLFQDAPDEEQPEGAEDTKSWFEILWPGVDLSLDIPD